MRNGKGLTLAAAFMAAWACLGTGPALSEEYGMPEVVVSGDKDGQAPMVSEPNPTPKSVVTREGIDLLGGPAQTSLYGPANLMPSVDVESPDPYGVSLNRNINIRGKADFHLAKNVMGLPVVGIVGGADLFDLENVEEVDVYRGGVPANGGLSPSNATGTIDQLLRGPKDTFGVFAKQSGGSDYFHRTFGRLDSGTLTDTGTRFFLSGSNFGADKWKGDGDTTRDNVMLGLSQGLGDNIKIDWYGVYANYKGNTYRSLTYSQAQDLGKYFKYDYNTSLTGVASQDVNYYKFNKTSYDNFATLANIDVKLDANNKIVVKPYYWGDYGVQYSASGNFVQKWTQDNDNVGGTIEYQGKYSTGTELTVGYWGQAMSAPPPPTDQVRYTVNADGSLKFANWNTLAKIDSFIFNSPYFQADQALGSTHLSAGLRYMDFGAPEMRYYKTTGLPDVAYDDVWKYNPALDANASVRAKDYRELLPNAGVRQDLSEAWSIALSYARKFGRPDWGPQASNYVSNEAAFLAKGITLQALVDKVRPELSDQLDLSTQFRQWGLTVTPTVFFAKNQNRQVLVTDPSLGNLTYYQGTAKTTQYGGELEVSYKISESWTAFGTGTLVSETYDDDTPVLTGGAALKTKDMQIPNAAMGMAKGGVTYRIGDFSATPVVRYIGRRYGDSVESQVVDAYTTVDLNAGYNFGLGHDVRLDFTVINLFNNHYIAQISPNDTNLNGATSYNVGAPLTMATSISASF